jgi:hypothetical protein
VIQKVGTSDALIIAATTENPDSIIEYLLEESLL